LELHLLKDVFSLRLGLGFLHFCHSELDVLFLVQEGFRLGECNEESIIDNDLGCLVPHEEVEHLISLC
jgi:hypothetical protein